MIHLPTEQLDMVKKILAIHAPGHRVVVLGSRASGIRLKPHSDLDLCIMGDAGLDDKTMRELRDAFAASNLPVRVDIINWAEASPIFHANILEHCENIA